MAQVNQKAFSNFGKPQLRFAKNELKAKKIMVYGFDGSGKSEFAETYCKDNDLHPVCFDFDKTNFSCNNIIQFKSLKTAKANCDYFVDMISAVEESEDFDTIIIDNVSYFFELLIGKGAGLSKYSERAEHWKKIKMSLLNSSLNFIFIGQIDSDIEYDKDSKDKQKPSSVMVSVHSICNEKYFCERTSKGDFVQFVRKYRGHGDYVGKTYDEIKDGD